MKIAIIPARGGSKRIPRKNIKFFHGKPIIAYSIEAAINSKLFDEVMVSTDDLEIAEVAKIYGAKIPFLRSVENSDDYSGTFEVMEEVINDYKKLNIILDMVCCIYPCSPFISTEHLISAFQKLNDGKYYSVFPVIKYSTPIQRALKIENNRIEMIDSKYALTRTQDLTPSYFDAGMFYWFRVNPILETRKIMTTNSSFIEINEIDSQDIDTPEDWEIAEFKYTLKSKKKERN